MKVTTKTILHSLTRLQSIKPRGDFSRASKEALLLVVTQNKKTIVSQPVQPHRTGLAIIVMRSSVLVVGTALIVAGMVYGGQKLSPLFLPGLNKQNIVAEADMVNSTINIELENLNHFDVTVKTSAQALNQVVGSTPHHLNESVLSADQLQIESLSPATTTDETNQTIESILQELQK